MRLRDNAEKQAARRKVDYLLACVSPTCDDCYTANFEDWHQESIYNSIGKSYHLHFIMDGDESPGWTVLSLVANFVKFRCVGFSLSGGACDWSIYPSRPRLLSASLFVVFR